MPITTREILFARRPIGEPTLETFELAERTLRDPGEGELLVRNLWLSVDPYMRGRMSTAKSYVAGFELDLDKVVAHAVAVPRFAAISSFPPVRQDLAVVVPEDLPAASVLGAVREAGGKLLTGARIFDVYRGEQIGEGRTSLALALTFQAPDRTLTDDDVAPVRDRIVAALAQRGGELRG